MHLHRRLLAALVILLGGYVRVLADWSRDGLRALLLGPDSGGIQLSGRYRCARRPSRTQQLVRPAIDETETLEHEA